ncbi:TPA: ABC transporter ATP-binding protein [Clostridioides difficile]|uniref:ABC transporter ATP-binding protein n=1 Tax=Clostridioides difficile TaxID=1496 RepID=UPI00038CF6D3|nr:ABC transporter ATP-binding protein [Clostridioides difficile]AXU28195.1 oligopeptide ABC transporter [Clostridioides difficile]AXU31992.1 oligopeptide ABC transporter [Clostridioides difficile]AXU35780.1 oligopeptide ABC transporter [Clostridioides difficile]EGT4967509.1 ABC transporter ATP-binding protein [Clostridioides difficile]EQE85019.1 oligopeptide/dipeptide ABC transporter, ATP-binding, C-terminal domain protein [Clostridioides difficile CD69]
MLLEVKNLNVEINNKVIIDDISFCVGEGEIISLVGESGSGKSLTSLAIMGLLPEKAKISGEIKLDEKNLVSLTEKEICKIRGKQISMIFQEPMTSLNPLFNIESQIGEVISIHEKTATKNIRNRVIDLLEKVKISNPQNILKKYPHELSGGMRQRVMIAMAIALSPKLLIADEPTTALDVTIQDDILNLLKEISFEMGMSIIFITHDLDVIAEIANKVIVMYLGKVFEKALVDEFFDNPLHPYSKGLMLSRTNNILESGRMFSIKGIVPNILDIPKGCRFNTRCDECFDKCIENSPTLIDVNKNHSVSCFIYQK